MQLVHTSSGVSLRRIQSSDRNRLVSLANNPNIACNLRNDFPHPYTLDHADEFIENARAATPTLRFCIEKDALYVGNIGLHPKEDIYKRNAEIGYFIGEPHWGQGIATEAVKLIVDYGFEELDIHRIFAGVFAYNSASRKVLENAGFEFEGASKDAVFKNGNYFDELRFAIINPNH